MTFYFALLTMIPFQLGVFKNASEACAARGWKERDPGIYRLTIVGDAYSFKRYSCYKVTPPPAPDVFEVIEDMDWEQAANEAARKTDAELCATAKEDWMRKALCRKEK